MSSITVGQENSTSIDLYYEDHGAGQPVVLVHGYALSSASWEKQVAALLAAGRRVITYDRRGFGRSSQPTVGYDYDTFATDLDILITTLDLKGLTLVGFSTGGGDVARYLGTYGLGRVDKVAFIASIPPFFLKTADNPEGMVQSFFEGLKQEIVADRPAFLRRFFTDLYNVDVFGGDRITDAVIQANWNTAVAASPHATLACVDAWQADFRSDMARIDIPALVIHGDADRIVPFAASGLRTHKVVRDSHLVVVEDGPHGILWTHPEIVNPELLDFLS